LVHIEDVTVGEALNVFVEGDELLDIAILAARGEDRVVDYDAIDGGVVVCSDYCIF
jgi:uncharacterized protein (UPF0218 family)